MVLLRILHNNQANSFQSLKARRIRLKDVRGLTELAETCPKEPRPSHTHTHTHSRYVDYVKTAC